MFCRIFIFYFGNIVLSCNFFYFQLFIVCYKVCRINAKNTSFYYEKI
ncbi:hypothetical protein OMAG_002749 [Candidatus Omnitrophus magneticus]|uniref:Uncharacterized protein n=1 Tax=Candidatus Omnitrophus magneticus TaxID=1609969 RepID=A0A0F0CJA6_9BACT|nr:hypothetical protein OMAG_002749 [Candidatus Omnitrophus magneticus]